MSKEVRKLWLVIDKGFNQYYFTTDQAKTHKDIQELYQESGRGRVEKSHQIQRIELVSDQALAAEYVGIDPLHCLFCGFQADSKEMLGDHLINDKHTEEDEYEPEGN